MSSTTPHQINPQHRFQIIHPYHPLFQQEFDLVQYRRNWGEDRVYFHTISGDLTSVPAIWTSLSSTDPLTAVAAGRSLFRVDDLLELATLVAALEHRDGGHGCKVNDADM